MGISLIPASDFGKGINLSYTAPQPVIDNNKLAQQAETTNYALGDKSPGMDTVSAYYFTGKQDVLAQQASLDEAIADRQRRQKLVSEYMASGRQPGVDDYLRIQELTKQDLTQNDKTILGQLYSRRLLSDAVVDTGSSLPPYVEASEFDQSGANRIMMGTDDVMSKQQIVKDALDKVEAYYNASSIGDKAYDFFRSFVPFMYNGIQTMYGDERINSDVPGGAVFNPGGTRAAFMRGLYSLNTVDFQDALDKHVKSLMDNGMSGADAADFLRAMLDYSGSDEFLANFNQAGDATLFVAPVAKLAKTGIGLIRANTRPLTPVSRLVVTGNSQAASRLSAFNRTNSKITVNPKFAVTPSGTPRPTLSVPEPVSQGYGILDPKTYMRDPGSLTNEAASRITDAVSSQRAMLFASSDDLTHLTRVNESAFTEAAYEAEAKFAKEYPKLEDAVLEIVPMRHSEEAFGGVDSIHIYLGETKTSLPFKTEAQATSVAEKLYRLPKGSYEVVPLSGGQNWAIQIVKTVDETSSSVADLRVQTTNKAPKNLINTFLGAIRNPDDVVSAENRAARKTVTYGGSGVMNRIREAAKVIGVLPKDQFEALSQVLEHSRFRPGVRHTRTGPVKVQGSFFRTATELESEYVSRFGRLPTEKEHIAYWTAKSIADLDYLTKNVSLLRDKARLGVEQKAFSAQFDGPRGLKVYRNTDFFEAKTIDALPPDSSGTYGVMWVSPTTGKAKFSLNDRFRPNRKLKNGKVSGDRAELQELIDSGNAKILQVMNPDDEVLRGLNVSKGEPVNYIVARDVKSKPLDDLQVPYTEGGDWNQATSKVYVKQPMTRKTGFGRRIYTGDKTAFGFDIPALANQIGNALEEGRKMLVRGAPKADITAFVSKNTPFADADEFARQFRIPGGNEDAPFDINSPFVVVDSGKTVADVRRLEDLFSEEVIDPSKGAHSLQPHILTYSKSDQLKPVQTVNNLGTEANPVFKIDQAPTINVMEAIARSARRIARDRYYVDFQHRSVEDWATQFADMLDAPRAQVMANPYRFLQNPVWRKGVSAPALAAAKNNRRAILTLLNFDDNDTKAWKWLRQSVVDGIYKARGQKDAEIVAPHLWDNKMDPAKFLRSVVFHAKLGLFNPIQLFTQGSGVIHALAIDGNPRRAAQAVFAFWHMRMRELSPDKLGGVLSAGVAKALGVDKNLLEDMYAAYRASGMNIISGEYGLLDDYLNPKFFDGAGHRALDAGTVFFREGNNLHKGTSFALSYLEWREANPLAKLTATDMQKIVDRADLMYINMSRASNNTLQHGLASVPFQFFGYHIRMTEQMLGTRLTMAEKLRLISAYSLMWGVPVGVAGTTIGTFWPVADSARQYMLENGIDGDANVVTSVLSKGLGSMLIDWMAHEDMDSSNRFGPGGLSYLKDLASGDLMHSFGAGPNFIGQTIATVKPFLNAMASVFNDDPTSNYKLKTEDFIDVLKGITSFNNATRAFAIYNTGQWLSKTDGPVASFEPGNWGLTVATAIGLTPQKVTDAYLMLESHNQAKDAQNAIAREVQTNFKRGLKAAQSGDTKQMEEFFARATWLMRAGAFTPLEQAQQFRRAMQDNEDLINSVGEDFMMDNPDVRRDQYIKQMEIN